MSKGLDDWDYTAGTNGAATIPKGATIIAIIAHASQASASFKIQGGADIPVPNGGSMPFPLDREHEIRALGDGSDVVFTNTDAFWVQFIRGA